MPKQREIFSWLNTWKSWDKLDTFSLGEVGGRCVYRIEKRKKFVVHIIHTIPIHSIYMFSFGVLLFVRLIVYRLCIFAAYSVIFRSSLFLYPLRIGEPHFIPVMLLMWFFVVVVVVLRFISLMFWRSPAGYSINGTENGDIDMWIRINWVFGVFVQWISAW